MEEKREKEKNREKKGERNEEENEKRNREGTGEKREKRNKERNGEENKEKSGKRGRIHRKWILFLGIAALVILLNVAAWNSTAFCDWYIANIFPIWVGTYGRLTGIFPFSVGEWLLGAGVVLVAFAPLLGVLWGCIGLVSIARRLLKAVRRLFFGSVHGRGSGNGSGGSGTGSGSICGNGAGGSGRGSGGMADSSGSKGSHPAENAGIRKPQKGMGRRLRHGFCRFTRGFYLFFAWTFLAVCLIMTLNCFILYHASTFSQHYFGEDEEEYTLEDLIAVYNMVAARCNSLAGSMERDATGMVLYKGGLGKAEALRDMGDQARELMAGLGEEYPRLSGYYPRPKALLSSDFMCQQHMQGYYFPFSMEANYNDVMHILNIPATMCHELAHLRGYIYEDEANFIGYLACVESEDEFFQYAGYLSVIGYLNNDIYYVWRDNPEVYEDAVKHIVPIGVDEQVWTDNIFVTQEEWDRINGKALLDTDMVDKAADAFIDGNLKLNGISDGKVSYSRVVRLLLQYYKLKGLPEGGIVVGKSDDLG